MNRRDFLLSTTALAATAVLPMAEPLAGSPKPIFYGEWVNLPADELIAARAAFEDAVARSMAGDADAISTVGPLSVRYNTLAGQFYGASTDYEYTFLQIQSALQDITFRKFLSA